MNRIRLVPDYDALLVPKQIAIITESVQALNDICVSLETENAAIRMVTQKLFEQQHSLWKTHWEMAQPRGVSVMTVHACDVCEEINLFHEELAELKAALEGK